QVMQRGSFLVAHAAREVRIIEALIAGRLRHVLQDAEFLVDDLLALPGHLAHSWQNVISDVVALIRRKPPPSSFVFAKRCLLLWGHVIPLVKLLTDLGLLVRRKILERLAVLQDTVALPR